MLTVRDLRKEFTNVVAVDGVSFSVQSGMLFGLIGPNGAGKSTTIRMIMNILKPDRGEVIIGGQAQNEATRNFIGYLPEERGLYKKNKLIHVIEYFASLKGMDAAAAKKAAAPWLERFSLEAYSRRSIEELSKGNQQKVQFIVSILHDPALVVLDELFSGLDPVNQHLMKEILLELKQRNKAIIFSTHQMDHAERLCDELLMINKGKTVLEGSPASVKRNYGKNSLTLEFTGSPRSFSSIAGVVKANIHQNHAELELHDWAETNAVIEELLHMVEIVGIARKEPSLQAIFLDIVGVDPSGTVEPGIQTAPPPKPAVNGRMKLLFVAAVVSFFLAFFCIAQAATGGGIGADFAIPSAIVFPLVLLRMYRERKRIKNEQLLDAAKEDAR